MSLNPVILYRGRDFEEHEKMEASKHFREIFNSRADVRPGDMVVCRYSALPFYVEMERDVVKMGGKVINTYNQHLYAADLQNWYEDLADYTPKTWFRLQDVPPWEGPFVLKGETNSRKFQWDTHMFAQNKEEAISVAGLLMDDGLICDQNICIRKYVPLVNYMTGFHGLPISQEFRLFVYKGRVLSVGYYWSSHVADLLEAGVGYECDPPYDWLNKILSIVADKMPFVVIDIAKTQEGKWIIIELNDGQMSGLSENKPSVLYGNLRKAIDQRG